MIQLNHLTQAATTRPDLRTARFSLILWVNRPTGWVEKGRLRLGSARMISITRKLSPPFELFLDEDQAQYFEDRIEEFPEPGFEIEYANTGNEMDESSTAEGQGDDNDLFLLFNGNMNKYTDRCMYPGYPSKYWDPFFEIEPPAE